MESRENAGHYQIRSLAHASLCNIDHFWGVCVWYLTDTATRLIDARFGIPINFETFLALGTLIINSASNRI
jgi:hypothetical protein